MTKYWCPSCNQVIYRSATAETLKSSCASAGDKTVVMVRVNPPKKKNKERAR
jgi:hypothetical protein